LNEQADCDVLGREHAEELFSFHVTHIKSVQGKGYKSYHYVNISEH